jgi:hypothetical protein
VEYRKEDRRIEKRLGFLKKKIGKNCSINEEIEKKMIH